MKVSQHFGTLYTLLVIGQIVLCNYSQLGPYIMLSMLPAMVLCIPTNVSTIVGMIIAFSASCLEMSALLFAAEASSRYSLEKT